MIDNNLDPEWNEVGQAGSEGARLLTETPNYSYSCLLFIFVEFLPLMSRH